MQVFILLLVSFIVNGCSGHGNFHSFVEGQNKMMNSNSKINNQWIKDFNHGLNPYQKPKLTSYDLDALPITRTLRKDGNIQENWSLAAVGVHGRYYIYYNVIDKVTNRYIDWNFVYCDKNKIDLNDESTYKECLKDTRITKEINKIYRIGVSRIFRKKYGYNIHEIATKKDNQQIVQDVLAEEKLCLNANVSIIRKIFVRAGGVRYMVECNR
jgi:hypothetical protein